MPCARRLSGARRLSWHADDAQNLPEENDDDAERYEAANLKRGEAERRAQQQRSPFRETPRHQAKTAALIDEYTNCIQLCQENKINQQNTWKLDLISNMDRMIQQPGSGGGEEMTNFQFASSTLDAGVKIYSYRVDSIYTETFKLMGGLSRSSKAPTSPSPSAASPSSGSPTNDGGAKNDDAPTGARGARRRARTTPATANTLEANPAALNTKKLELAFQTDPLFHRTSAKFDEGGARGLLLHNLGVRNGLDLVFDSSEVSQPKSATAALPVALGGLYELVPSELAARHVCPELREFTSELCCNADGVAVPPLAAAPSEECCDAGLEDSLPFDDDDDVQGPNDDEELGFDPSAQACASDVADDMSAMYDTADVDVQARERALERVSAEEHEGIAAILTTAEIAEDTEATSSEAADAYLQEQAQRLLPAGPWWVGPAHWKFRAAPRGAATATDQPKRASKNAKAPFLIDFSKSAEAARALAAAPLDPKGAVLSQAQLTKMSALDLTLPKDCQCSFDVLQTLFHKPERVRTVRRKLAGRRSTPPVAPDHNGAAHEPDERCDSDGGFAGIDDDQGDAGDGGTGFDDAHGDIDGGIGQAPDDELVAAPVRPEKIEIGYARVAKQVNIKGLKAVIWELLEEANLAASESGVSFQRVLAQLGSKLPEHTLADVSFAYCFICLLHLANEKGLDISGDADYNDMTVRLPRKS